jgi:hypothetical protein
MFSSTNLVAVWLALLASWASPLFGQTAAPPASDRPPTRADQLEVATDLYYVTVVKQ